MLLKRKAYWFAIGFVVASHLSLAKYWDQGQPARFGDCPTCQRSESFTPPLPTSNANFVASINAKLSGSQTSFVYGNGLNSAVPNLTTTPAALAAMNAEQAARMPIPAAVAPFAPPQYSWPTQARVESLFAPTWMQSCTALMAAPLSQFGYAGLLWL